MMILNLSESLAKPIVMAKLNMAYLSILKNQRYDDFFLENQRYDDLNLSKSLAKPLVMAKLNMAYLSILKIQRYDDFKLIRITCQAARHGKTEHCLFVN